MKKTFITFCVTVLPFFTFGQAIKPQKPDVDDLMTLLNAAGYEIFSYDITEMLKERYEIVLIKKEFKAGNEIGSSELFTTQNKRLLTDFPEPSRKKFTADGGKIIDRKTQAITHAEKINIGFRPSGNDSTKYLQINIPNMRGLSAPLKLNGLVKKNANDKFYSYHTRPFKLEKFEAGEFIPLVLLGSFWFDEKSNVYRFCGETEIDPLMASEILKNIPHYYVIGVKFLKKQ